MSGERRTRMKKMMAVYHRTRKNWLKKFLRTGRQVQGRQNPTDRYGVVPWPAGSAARATRRLWKSGTRWVTRRRHRGRRKVRDQPAEREAAWTYGSVPHERASVGRAVDAVFRIFYYTAIMNFIHWPLEGIILE